MIFRKKKPESAGSSGSVLRGRESTDDAARPGSGRGKNPLARRFQLESEPDTIDLDDPARFHSVSEAGENEPTTDLIEEVPDSIEKAREHRTRGREKVLSQDTETGKFYIHPGEGEIEVYLGDDPVTAPTELRSGDIIRIGKAEFHFKI
jgi:hypothetical protein